MEIKINKEIRNYTESMFFGLNARQCIFSLLAIGIAVAIYFGLRGYLGTETISWLCILGAAPLQRYARREIHRSVYTLGVSYAQTAAVPAHQCLL